MMATLPLLKRGMVMNLSDLSFKQVYDAIMAVDDKGYNPWIDGGCVYTDYDDNHCIAGQVLVDLGFEKLLPSEDSELNIATVYSLFSATPGLNNVDPVVTDLLREAQTHADNYVIWGEVKGKVEDWVLDRHPDLVKIV